MLVCKVCNCLFGKLNIFNTVYLNPFSAYTPALKFFPAPWAYTYARVEQSLYNRLFIGYYNSAACQAVSITLPEGCSIGYVPLFLVFYFLLPKKSTGIPKHDPKVEVLHLVTYHDSPVRSPTR